MPTTKGHAVPDADDSIPQAQVTTTTTDNTPDIVNVVVARVCDHDSMSSHL